MNLTLLNVIKIQMRNSMFMLGICMESMCSPTSRLPVETVEKCLRGLCALLEPRWPRKQLGDDPVLSRELLNVMHRYVLRAHPRLPTVANP